VSLQQTSVFFFSGLAAIIFLSLITHSINDCGFFRHDSQCSVSNKAGSIGATLSDILFGFFGYLAYLIPIILIIVGVVMFRFPHKKNPHNPRGGVNAWLTAGGMIMAMVAGSGLATLLWPQDELVYGIPGGGGLLGMGIAKITWSKFGDYGSTLLLVSIFFAGITILADIRWGEVVEFIGDKIMTLFEFLVKTTEGAKSADDADSSKAGTKVAAQGGKADSDTGSGSGKGMGVKDLFDSGVAKVTGIGAGLGSLWALGKNKATAKKESPNVDPVEQDDDSDALFKPADPILEAPDFRANPRVEPSSFDDVDSSPKPAVNGVETENEAPLNPPKKPGKPVVKQPLRLDKAIALPPLSLLNPPPAGQGKFSPEHLDRMANNIVEALGHYGVHDVTVESYYPGPVITRYELQLKAGTKVSKVSNLVKDIARTLGVHSVRIVEIIPGKTTIGLEVPNESRDLVTIGSVLESAAFNQASSSLTLVLGKNIGGKPVVADLAKMPHLLVAGTTGSGKSVCINAMLLSLLYKSTPEEVRLILIDPKMLELSIYEDIPHLLTPVVTDMKNAANSLRWSVAEMERRYLLMSKLKVRSIESFNEKVQDAINRGDPIIDPLFDPTKMLDPTPKALEPLPKIVIVVDEFADMMMVVGKKVEELIARIAQKARAAGIHLILATQRPSVDVITGLIKANIPTRIAFQVSTRVDSRTILDQGGAEQLLGMGDMLYLPPGTALPRRVHGAFVGDSEVEAVVKYLKTQGEPDYIEDVIQEPTGNSSAIPGLEPISETESESDPLYDEAVSVITESRRASISYLQRRLKVGYNRAASMIEDMEKAGVVSGVQSNGTREVLAPPPVSD
jgi:S-DNA-T family DNA segregation ATPase FtsK/SpoIIIE